MAEFIGPAGDNLELWKVDINEIREQDINARTMPPDMFERLTENIKKEGRLESLPLTVKRDKVFELISGHHRTRAARSAGITELIVLADTRDLDRSQVVAKQLAHNVIDGQDDAQIIKRLLEDIDRVDDLIESYVDPKQFENLPLTPAAVLGDVLLEFDYRMLSFTFLPPELARFDELAALVPDNADEIGVATLETYEKFKEAVIKLGKTEKIKSINAILARMIEITEGHLKAQEEAKDGIYC
ncbi:MAG: ParB/RepB/Spo0J family partition protein [Desulfobacteraceae bacterium]